MHGNYHSWCTAFLGILSFYILVHPANYLLCRCINSTYYYSCVACSELIIIIHWPLVITLPIRMWLLEFRLFVDFHPKRNIGCWFSKEKRKKKAIVCLVEIWTRHMWGNVWTEMLKQRMEWKQSTVRCYRNVQQESKMGERGKAKERRERGTGARKEKWKRKGKERGHHHCPCLIRSVSFACLLSSSLSLSLPVELKTAPQQEEGELLISQ